MPIPHRLTPPLPLRPFTKHYATVVEIKLGTPININIKSVGVAEFAHEVEVHVVTLQLVVELYILSVSLSFSTTHYALT